MRVWPVLLLASCAAGLEELYSWYFLPFRLPLDFPPDQYIPENNVFTGLEVGWNRVFVAIPRLRNGVAATLASMPRYSHLQSQPASPLLEPYPSARWHSQSGNCSSRLVSVYRVRLDRCDRLWVLDSGLMDSLGTFTRVCPPKLLTFDLRTDQLARSVTFPQDVLRPSSLLTNLVIDDEGAATCEDVVIYLSDTTAPGIVVYDAGRDSMWRVSHPYMWPSADHSFFTVAGEPFTLMDGVVGLALSAPSPQRQLYFQPMAETRLFAVPTAALRRGPLAELEELPVRVVGHKSSQSAVLHVDQRDGTVLLSPVREGAVAAWHPAVDTASVLAYSPELIQFSSELIVAPRDDHNIWLLSSRFQKFFRRTYNPNEINMRILRVRPCNPLHGPCHGRLNATFLVGGL